MTLFDLRMINQYRRENPHLDHLVSGIAQYLGVYRPPEPEVKTPVSLPDPRPELAELFKNAKFAPSDGVHNVF